MDSKKFDSQIQAIAERLSRGDKFLAEELRSEMHIAVGKLADCIPYVFIDWIADVARAYLTERMWIMTDARKELDTAIKELIDDYEARDVEPEPPERKIDHPCLQGWHYGESSVVDSDGWNVNHPGCNRSNADDHINTDIILAAPGTMADLINWVNEWYSHGEAIVATSWMKDGMLRLRQRVIDNGFECDLD